jgi:hypothetical protein
MGGDSWFPCAAWEPILDALHPVQGKQDRRIPSGQWMRRIPHCIPMRRMGTRGKFSLSLI